MINLLLMMLFIIHAGYSMKDGSPAQSGEFTYIASIQAINYHVCTGIIIDEKHIITTAHTIDVFIPWNLKVFVGKNVMYPRYTAHYTVKEVYTHPGFKIRGFLGRENSTYYDHDIAVLRLHRSLNWSSSISPISLVNEEREWSCYSECILISWNIPRDRRKAMILSWELVKVMGNEMHRQSAVYLGKNQRFFSDYFRATAIGMEDLGGSLVCANTLIGLVVKEEKRRSPEHLPIMMSIAPYLDFINDVAHDGLFNVKAGDFPYIASIWSNSYYACGGFIVDATHVATAGHCLMTYRMSNLTVSLGYPPQWFSINDSAIHPHYQVKNADIPSGWYIDHDFGLLTLSKPIVWNAKTSPVSFVGSDDFHAGQHCKLLRWEFYKDEETQIETRRLKFSFVVILNNQCLQSQLNSSNQSQVPSFWGTSRYLMPIADYADVGNPIICGGNPVGFFIQALSFDQKPTALVAKFLKIRPYIEFSNSSWLHDH